MKICKTCSLAKPDEEYYKFRGRMIAHCKPCYLKQQTKTKRTLVYETIGSQCEYCYTPFPGRYKPLALYDSSSRSYFPLTFLTQLSKGKIRALSMTGNVQTICCNCYAITKHYEDE